jgi:large subunit ribosomal protein L23
MEILKKPILTEKVAAMGEKLNRYAFVVDRKANKIQIKNAVEAMFSVSVKSVNTMITPGKAKSRGTKNGVVTGSTGRVKKAIVELAEGNTIDFYNNI